MQEQFKSSRQVSTKMGNDHHRYPSQLHFSLGTITWLRTLGDATLLVGYRGRNVDDNVKCL